MTALRRFKPYPAYKNSGVEWLREIPTHWCRRFKSPLGTPSRQPFDADDTGVGERLNSGSPVITTPPRSRAATTAKASGATGSDEAALAFRDVERLAEVDHYRPRARSLLCSASSARVRDVRPQ